jgi:hypothetical protein
MKEKIVELNPGEGEAVAAIAYLIRRDLDRYEEALDDDDANPPARSLYAEDADELKLIVDYIRKFPRGNAFWGYDVHELEIEPLALALYRLGIRA